MRVLSHLAALSLLTAVAAPAGAQNVAASIAPAVASNAAQSIALSIATPASPATSTLAPSVPTSDAATVAAPSQLASVSMTGLRAGVHPLDSNAPAVPTIAAKNAGFGQPVALMVVGFAGLVAGAIIGGTPGTVVMVGGAAVGLIGLYQYLQ